MSSIARDFTDSHVQKTCHVHVICSGKNLCSYSCRVMCSGNKKILALCWRDQGTPNSDVILGVPGTKTDF